MAAVPRWTPDYQGGIYLGPVDDPNTEWVLPPDDALWVAETVARVHNAQVDAAGRPAIEVEKLLTRVAVATVRELAQGLIPRWLRRRR